LFCFFSLHYAEIGDISNVYVSFNVNEADSPKLRKPPPKAPIPNHQISSQEETAEFAAVPAVF